MAGLTDYTIDTSGTPEDVQRRQKLAEALLQQGMDTSAAAGGPNGGWLTAANRGLAGALGGYRAAEAAQQDREARAQANAQLIALLGGGNTQPQSPMGSIASAPQGVPAPQRAAPVRVASAPANDDEDDTPAPAAPPGAASGLPTFAPNGKMMGNLTGNVGQPPATATPVVPPVTANAAVASRFPAQSGLNPATLSYLTNPYGNKAVQSAMLTKALTPRDHFTDMKDADGNWYQVNDLTGQKTMIHAADKDPTSKLEYDAYVADEKAHGREPVSYGQFTGKAPPQGSIDNSTLTGDEYLKTLPPGESDIVKKIAEYDIDPKSLSVKGGHREDLLKKVSQYDPDYSEPLYTSRKAAIKEFGSGGPSSPAGQITAGNTAILHAGEMSDALEKLKQNSSGALGYVGQSGIPFLSYYANKMHNASIKGTGTEEAKALSEFQTAKNHFSEEVTKFYAGSGGSEAERDRALANIDEAKSLPELQSAIQQEARLMGGKINTLQDRIKTAMGPSAWKRAMKEAGGQFPIVQQQSADQLKKIENRAASKAPVSVDGYTIQEH